MLLSALVCYEPENGWPALPCISLLRLLRESHLSLRHPILFYFLWGQRGS